MFFLPWAALLIFYHLSVNQSTLYIHSSNKSSKAYGAKPKKKEEIQNYYNYIIIVQ